MTKTNLKPAAGYLVIEPKKKGSSTESGIYLQPSNDKPQEGTVLAIGQAYLTDFGIKKDSGDLKTGDVVIYREWGGKEYKENGVELLLMKFDDIMATIKN